MGYTTQFEGAFDISPRLLDSHALYLLKFSKTRRVKRNVAILRSLPDPGREAVDLSLGTEGEYFIAAADPAAETSILDDNRPPTTQPSLWCQWIPTPDGGGLQWDGREKFYRYVEWLQYLIDHFLDRWNYQLNGIVTWQGETGADRGEIVVIDNCITGPSNAKQRLAIATSPIQVPLSVWQGLFAIQSSDPMCLTSWVRAVEQAEKLGYSETQEWIEGNLNGQYALGVDRGFQAIETREQFVPTCYPIGSWVN
ncbi:hypothetical protein ACQ4M3_24470 [Leptolyngbya sp. AN03gr2]|uniref:hypothetical protein n=1 Tax=unclassified Leptolyngbya TaxID=2650499 RepID=UPI003D30F3AC